MNFKRANTKFDELYEIRLATPNDIDNIMAFLKAYWDKNHILAVNRDFFEYEFRVGDRVNYILAVNRQTGKIDACEGIYIYSKGDDSTEPFDMAGGMFRTSPHALLPFLGLEILYRKRFMMGVKMRSYIGIGAKKETTYILTKKYFKDDMVGRLDHFYRLNDKKEYKIAHITHKTILDIESSGDYIKEVLRIVSKRFQTLTYFGVDSQMILEEIATLGILGIDRIVPIGKSSDFSLIWDGYDIINTMSRVIDVR